MLTHPYLQKVQATGMRLGLDRVTDLLAFLGDPQAHWPAVHVGGTNGKGSVCAMLTGVLRCAGLRVGTTISPHLQAVNERILVDGVPVADPVLDALLARIDAATSAWAADRGHTEGLTYFEAMVVAAWLHFAESKVDVGVVEVGLGGRLDATRTCHPLVTAIVTVGLDHTEQLGPDLASIAAEKAGIVRPGVPLVVGRLAPAALRVVRSMAADRGAACFVAGEDFALEQGTWRGPEGRLEGVEVGLEGEHQRRNAEVALMVVACLDDHLPLPPWARREGVARARHPGRVERLAADVVVDGAHNADGAAALAAWLAGRPRERRRTLLLGCSEDKDVRALAAVLAPQVDRVLTTSCSHPRAMAPGHLASRLVGLSVPVLPAGAVEEALPLARVAGDEVVVAGSLFLVGAVRELMGLPPGAVG